MGGNDLEGGDGRRVAEMRATYEVPLTPSDLLSGYGDADLIRLRAALDVEMKKRKIAVTVGQMAEDLAIEFFNRTPGRPNLSPAQTGTACVDALSRRGERYSIKGLCNAKKTGQIYPDPEDDRKQLFEFLLVVKLDKAWSLEAIYEFDWPTFCEVRSWDKRMSAWYVGASARKLSRATKYVPA
jgi:hypothetical protein